MWHLTVEQYSTQNELALNHPVQRLHSDVFQPTSGQ